MNREFEAIYESFKDIVFTMAYRYLGDKQAAFDVSQDVFIKIFEHPGRLPKGNGQKAYILRMTMNRSIDMLRKMKPLQRLPEGAEIGVVEDRNTEESDEVAFLLSGLNPDQKTAIILKEILGCSYDEIAQACETDIGTIRSRLSRAKDKMRETYQQRENHGY